MFYIGGESALIQTVFTTGGTRGPYSVIYFGEQLGAMMVALEHRFYGQSYPINGSLALLSSR